MTAFGLSTSEGSESAANSSLLTETGRIDQSTPWVAAADGDLVLLQSAAQTLEGRLSKPLASAADENGYTLFHAAASYGHRHIVEWLLFPLTDNEDQRASAVNATDHEGDSALHYTDDLNMAKYLVEHLGIDVSIRNNSGLTALESKKVELQDSMDDESEDEEEEEISNLKEMIAYLESRI
jgi:Ankyrin repeats (3 copies)